MGVAQVNKAMTQVDKVTQRNAAWAEELSITADQMAAQAENLQQLMSVFRVDRSDTHSSARSIAVNNTAPTNDAEPDQTGARQERSLGKRAPAKGAQRNGMTGFKPSHWTNEL